MPAKKKLLPFLLLFMLLTSVVEKGHACLSEKVSSSHIEAANGKRYADMLSVLGEGLVKTPLSGDQWIHGDFYLLDPFSAIRSSSLYIFDFWLEKPLDFLRYAFTCQEPPSVPVFISVRALLI